MDCDFGGLKYCPCCKEEKPRGLHFSPKGHYCAACIQLKAEENRKKTKASKKRINKAFVNDTGNRFT